MQQSRIGLINKFRSNKSYYAYTLEDLNISTNQFSENFDGSLGYNRYDLINEDFTVGLKKYKDVSIVSFVGSGNNENFLNIYKLLNEAIDIICFRRVYYLIQDAYNEQFNCSFTKIFSHRIQDKSNSKLIESDFSAKGNDDIGSFIIKYIEKFKKEPVIFSNLLYLWWYRVYGNLIDIENKLLVLSVGIESVCLKYINSQDCTSFIYDFKELRIIGHCIKESGVSKDLIDRVTAYVGNLNSSSKPIVYILKRLVEIGVLLEGMNTEWQSLRNDSAHGIERNLNQEDELTLQRVISEVLLLEEIYFRLMFYIVDYRGGFHQFSRLDYPIGYLYRTD